MAVTAESIIVPPLSAPEAPAAFVARCIIDGIEFYVEGGDVLPRAVPSDIGEVRGIVIEDDQFSANEKAIAAYQSAGACVYRMRRANAATVPNATLSWTGELTF